MRYSLQSLMILTLVVALLCMLFSQFSPNPFLELFLMIFKAIVPAILAAGVVYGKGDQRAFAIGCSASLVANLLQSRDGSSYRDSWPLISLFMIPFQIGLLAVGGFLAVLVRRYLLNQHSESFSSSSRPASDRRASILNEDGEV